MAYIGRGPVFTCVYIGPGYEQCDLLRIVFFGAPIVLSGCREMTANEKRITNRRIRLMKKSRTERQNLIRKMEKGYEAYLPPEKVHSKRRK